MEWIGSGTRTYLTTVDAVLKAHCYIAGTKYDDLLTEYIKVASDVIEQHLGYPLTYPTVTVYNESESGKTIYLPKNINAITTIHLWEDEAWTAQTLTSPTLIGRNRITEYFHTDLKAGKYKIVGTTSITVSNKAAQCCRLLVADMFENRQNREYKTPNDMVTRLLHDEALLML